MPWYLAGHCFSSDEARLLYEKYHNPKKLKFARISQGEMGGFDVYYEKSESTYFEESKKQEHWFKRLITK